MPVHRECPSLDERPASNVEPCSDGKRRSNGKNGAEGTERVEWLWPGRLAPGHLTILAGGTMSGKSFLSADLAARATNGFGWPGALGERPDVGNGEIAPSAKPARVLIMPANPSRAGRLRPRLEAAGADLERVVVVEQMRISNDEIVGAIEKALARAGDCKLVIFEPPPIAFASRGAELDLECVTFFQSLADLAARRKVAVLAVVGLRHDFSAPVSKRQLGALASCGAAMSVWAALRDEASPELRYLVAARSPEADDQTAMAFRIRQDRSCGTRAAARVEWRSEVLATADGASRAFGGAAASRRAVRIDAMRWLKSLLRGGGLPVTEIQREARDAGYSWGTVRRARQELPVRAYREYNGCDGHWFWQMGAEAWLAGESRVAAKKKPLPEVQVVNLATINPATVNLATAPQGAQLAEQGAQLARHVTDRLTPAARPEQENIGRLTPAACQDQGAQLAGQGAQLTRENNSRLTPAARPEQEIIGRLTPGYPRSGSAHHECENGRPAVSGGPGHDRAAAKARRMKRKEKKKMRRLVAIGLRR